MVHVVPLCSLHSTFSGNDFVSFQSLIPWAERTSWWLRLTAASVDVWVLQIENVPAPKWIIADQHITSPNSLKVGLRQNQNKTCMSRRIPIRLWINISWIFIHFYESRLGSNVQRRFWWTWRALKSFLFWFPAQFKLRNIVFIDFCCCCCCFSSMFIPEWDYSNTGVKIFKYACMFYSCCTIP